MIKERSGDLQFYVGVTVEVAPAKKPQYRPNDTKGETEENIAAWRSYIDSLPHLTYEQVEVLFDDKKTTNNWFFYSDRTAKKPFDWIEFDTKEYDPETGELELATYAATEQDAREIRLMFIHKKKKAQQHFDALLKDHQYRNHPSD